MNEEILHILEAILFTAGEPLSIARIKAVLTASLNNQSSQTSNQDDDHQDNHQEEEPGQKEPEQSIHSVHSPALNHAHSDQQIRTWLYQLGELYQNRGIELVEVASGYRFQAKADYAPWIHQLFSKKPARYSRALLETLALIAYRQPITRGEIEEIRGVAVSTQIMKTLTSRDWIRVIGTKDVPGKPVLLGTTKQFLDDFNLKTLAELPPLQQLTDLDAVASQIELKLVDEEAESSSLPIDAVAMAENLSS